MDGYLDKVLSERHGSASLYDCICSSYASSPIVACTTTSV